MNSMNRNIIVIYNATTWTKSILALLDKSGIDYKHTLEGTPTLRSKSDKIGCCNVIEFNSKDDIIVAKLLLHEYTDIFLDTKQQIYFNVKQ